MAMAKLNQSETWVVDGREYVAASAMKRLYGISPQQIKKHNLAVHMAALKALGIPNTHCSYINDEFSSGDCYNLDPRQDGHPAPGEKCYCQVRDEYENAIRTGQIQIHTHTVLRALDYPEGLGKRMIYAVDDLKKLAVTNG